MCLVATTLDGSVLEHEQLSKKFKLYLVDMVCEMMMTFMNVCPIKAESLTESKWTEITHWWPVYLEWFPNLSLEQLMAK